MTGSTDFEGDGSVDAADASQIIQRLREGGLPELTQLFMKMRPQIRGMVQSRLDRRILSRVDASDIVQETFVRASQGFNNYIHEPKAHPVVWLRLISKHLIAETCRYHFRGKRSPEREQMVEDDGSDLLINKVADSMTSVGSVLDHAHMVQQVKTTLQQLSQIDREIIEMRHIEGLTLHEAADSLELSYETTKKRYFRAIKRFREYAEHLK